MSSPINYFQMLDYEKNEQTRFLTCDNCGELFSNVDNREFVIDKEIDYKWDMFGDLESTEEYELYRVIHRCPYCKWKHKENIPNWRS